MSAPRSVPPGTSPITDTVDLLVKLGDTALEGAAAASLIDVSVHQALGEAAHLTLRLAAWDADTEALTWVDDPRFAPGNAVAVELGFLNQRMPVFWGEIVGLDLEASSTERAVLTINAYDLLHRFGRGQRRAPPYNDMTCAAIVRKIAQEVYKLAVDAKDDPESDPPNPSIQQQNQSDLDFLNGLAARIQYDLFVDAGGKTLVFRKSRLDASRRLTLDASGDLVQFSARLDAQGQLGGVEVSAFDSDAKKRIKVGVDNRDKLDDRFGAVPSRSQITLEPRATQEKAVAHANAELQRIRATYLTAWGTCFGRTELRPGLMIGIVGFGARFDGPYYVLTTTHTVSATGGYRTSFELQGVPR